MEFIVKYFLNQFIKQSNYVIYHIRHKVLATLTNVDGEKTVISYQFQTAKRGMFKEEMERQILNTMNNSGIKKIIKVRVHL